MTTNPDKLRILFVCTGNTCRSPMAAAALRSRLDPGLAARVEVESAGIAASEGAPTTPAAVAALARAGIAAPAHRARRLDPEMVRRADLILVMEPQHRQAVLAMAPDCADRVHLLHAFGRRDEAAPEETVHDPIGGSAEVYEEALGRIQRHLDRVLRFIRERVADGARDREHGS